MKNWTISDIEAMTEDAAREMALEVLPIKEHTVYLVDFGGYFGYSCLVFCEGHHIYYANDYQLHHPTMQRAEIRTFFVESLNSTLFTEAEILEPMKSYDEQTRKERFLHSYYGMRKDYVSIFGNFSDKKYEQEYRRKTANMIYDPVAFAYYAPEEADFVKHHCELLKGLVKQRENVADNYEYQKAAFLHEMYNHEYGINLQADWDVCSVFCAGALIYHRGEGSELQDYFEQCKFTDTQRRAYLDARTQYYEETRDRM